MSKNRVPEWATNYNSLVESRTIQDITRRIQILERTAVGGGGGGGGVSLSALHSALLGVKVWSGTAYVWPGDGNAPDTNAYTNIIFIDPTGTHDPATASGGRIVVNDLWETG